MERDNRTTSQIWNNILQFWYGGYLDISSEKRRNQVSPRKHLHKIRAILKESFGLFIRLFIPLSLPTNKIWFFSISYNNFAALKGIQEKIPDSIIVSNHSFSNKQQRGDYRLILRYRFFHTILFPLRILSPLLIDYKRTTKFYDLMFKTNGVFSECRRVLKNKKPKAIIFGNDHEILPRGLLLAANSLKIPTYYVQHAAVSKYFPPLLFKYALLEGEDSKLKYEEIGVTGTRIFKIGIPRFDKYCNFVNKKKEVKSVGIAYNAMDNLSEVNGLLETLTQEFPALNFIVRPHPSDKRVFDNPKTQYSNSLKEGAFEFLSKIDVLIAADSTIHLEAVMLNVYSIGFGFGNLGYLDYYGFGKNGLLPYCETMKGVIDEIFSILMNKPNIQYKAAFYNAAIGSNFYGKSSEKASRIIMETILER